MEEFYVPAGKLRNSRCTTHRHSPPPTPFTLRPRSLLERSLHSEAPGRFTKLELELAAREARSSEPN